MEGEPLVVSGSGGESIGSNPKYFEARTFTFKAAQPNETISGTIAGADGDESCSLSAIVTEKSLKFGFLTQGDRDALESSADQLIVIGSATGVVAALCTEAIITAPICGAPLASATALTLADAAVLNLVAHDPSDPNFTILVDAVIPTVPTVTASGVVTQAEADAFNALFANQAAGIAYGLAAVTSFNRAQGAFDAGDTFWQAQQMQAAENFLGLLVGTLSAESTLRSNLANLLSADPNFATFSFSPNQGLTGESLLASGVPQSIPQALQALGLDSTTVSDAVGALFVQDVNVTSGNVVSKIANPTLLNALNSVVTALGITVQIDIKPGDNTDAASINSASHGKVPVAILSTQTFDATTQVDTSSLTFGHSGDEKSLAFCNSGGEDVDGDGLPDLVCHFDTPTAGLQQGDTTATLRGRTVGNVPIVGTASISVVH